MTNPFKPTKAFKEQQLNKSKGILDDYAVRKNVATREGTITKEPTTDIDITNKKYVDDKTVESFPTLFNAGSVIFSDGSNLAQDNLNLYWDNVNKELQPNLIRIESDGSQAYPALKFNDTNTGFYKSGNSIRTSINNNTIMTVNATGVGIGTDTPAGQLHIQGITGGGGIKMTRSVAGAEGTLGNLGYGNDLDGNLAFIRGKQDGAVDSSRLEFYTRKEGVAVESMTIKGDGKIGIGTDSPDELLHLYSSTLDGAKLKLEGEQDGGGTKYAEVYVNRYGALVYTGDIARVAFNDVDLRIGSNQRLNMGDSSEYTLGYNIANTRFQLASRDIDGIGTNGNIIEIYDGTDDVIFNGNVGINVTDPHSKLEVAGAISSATDNISSDVDSKNVSGINTLFVDTSGANVTLGGLSAGVNGQVLYIVISTPGHNLIFESGSGTQQFINHTGITETIDGGGASYICDGTNWIDCSHARHV